MDAEQEKINFYKFSSQDSEATARFLKSIIESSAGFIYVVDCLSNEFVFVSEKLEDTVGYKIDEVGLDSESRRSLTHPDDLEVLDIRRNKVLQSTKDELISAVSRFKHKQGNWLWLQTQERVFERDLDGNPVLIIGFGQDITEAYETEQALVKTLDQNEFLLETSRILSDPTVNYTEALSELAKCISRHLNVLCDISILNAQTNEIVSEAFYHPDKKIYEALAQTLSKAKIKKGEGLVGKVIATGKELLVNDVLEGKQGAAVVLDSSIVAKSLIYHPLVGSKGVIGSLNLTRLKGNECFSDDELKGIKQLVNHVSVFIENRLLQIVQAKEIEERKKIEQRLELVAAAVEKSESETRNMLNAIPVYVARVSKDLKYTFLNDKFRDLGIAPAELEGKKIGSIVGTENLGDFESKIQAVLKGETVVYEYNQLINQGIYRYLDLAMAPDYGEDGDIKGLFVCATDVTGKVNAQKQAALTQDRLKTLTLNSGDAFFFHDEDQNILDVNQVATEMFGYSRKEFLALKASDIDPRWNQTGYKRFLEKVEVNHPQTFDTSAIKKNGEEVPVEVRFVKRVENGKTYIQSLVRDRRLKKRQEEKLQASEERLRVLFKNLDDVVTLIAADGTILSINKTRQGLTEADFIGKQIYNILPQDKQDAVREIIKRVLKTNKAEHTESEFHGPDGSAKWYMTSYVPLGKNADKLMMISKDVSAERNRERFVLDAALSGQEQERKRLGAELHDGIGQILSAISLDVSQLKENIADATHEEIDGELKVLSNKLQTAISEVRSISHDLMPEVLESFGLKEAVKQTCASLRRRFEIDVKFNHVDLQDRYHPVLEMNLYRITQELLNNIQKHALCNKVFVGLIDHGTTLNLTVEDDGIGFDTKQENKGIGLKNIKSRVTMLKGLIDVESEAGHGSLVSIEIPKQFKQG
ncbi:PAS domain S-box protein [Bacteroidota bacterium]